MRTLGITLAVLAALVGEASAQASDGASATSAVEGTVRGVFEGRSRVLSFAVVEAVGDGYERSTVADSLGRYHIAGLAPGEARLRASHAGHADLALTVLLPPDATVRVDLDLRTTPIELAAVDVDGEARADTAEPTEARTEPALSEIEMQAMELGPGVGQPGLLEAVRALPGNDPAEATDVLFMRGSTTDLKLVLLDGVPVYTPFHVAGLLRSFEPSVLGRADLHVGGAPARYDGGLTHILDLGTRRARRDRLRGSGSVDLLSAAVAAEAPLGADAGLLVSARSLHDLGSGPLGGPGPYGYRDALVAFDADPAAGHAVRGTAFWNAESVRLDFEPGADDATWSNRAGSIGYQARLEAVTLDLTAGASGYRAALPLQARGDPEEPPPPPLRADAAVDRVRLVAEARWGSAQAPIRTGLSFDRVDARFSARGNGSDVSSASATSVPGAFVDLTRRLRPSLTLRAGLRGDLFPVGGGRLAPRAALHWEIGPEALLTVAAGRYHQPTRAPDYEVERTLAEVAHDSLPPGELLPVASADHVVLSLNQRLGGRVGLSLEGFWKRFEGLQASPRETVLSSGIDLRVATTGEAGVAWLGYGLSWFWSTVDLSGHASDFAGRHLLSAGASGRMIGPLRGEARLAYGAGLPYTSIPFRSRSDLAANTAGPESPGDGTGEDLETASASPIVGGLDEAFLRIDLEVHALLEPTWGGRPWQVRPYVRVINALDRRDALFYTFQPWRPDSVRPLAERPFLPLLGVSFSF